MSTDSTMTRLTLIAAASALPFFIGLGMRYGWASTIIVFVPVSAVGWLILSIIWEENQE